MDVPAFYFFPVYGCPGFLDVPAFRWMSRLFRLFILRHKPAPVRAGHHRRRSADTRTPQRQEPGRQHHQGKQQQAETVQGRNGRRALREHDFDADFRGIAL